MTLAGIWLKIYRLLRLLGAKEFCTDTFEEFILGLCLGDLHSKYRNVETWDLGGEHGVMSHSERRRTELDSGFHFNVLVYIIRIGRSISIHRGAIPCHNNNPTNPKRKLNETAEGDSSKGM